MTPTEDETIVAGSGQTIVPVAGAVATGFASLAAAWSTVSERRL